MATKQALPIYPLPNGGYRVRPTLQNPYTKRMQQIEVRSKKWTYNDAEKELKRIYKRSTEYFKPTINTTSDSDSNISDNHLKVSKGEKCTLDQLFQRWVVHRKKDYKTSYDEVCDNSYKKYILKELGSKRLCDLNQLMITNWVNELCTKTVTNGNAKRLGQPLKDKTINRVITVLANLIEYGVIHEGLNLNYTAYHINENDNDEERVIWKDEQIAKFLKIVKDSGNEFDYLFFSILSSTAMRKSEVKALKCSSVDFENSRILVNQNICRKAKGDSDKSYVITKTKGKDSTYIPLGKHELSALKNHISKLEKEYGYDANEYFIFGGVEIKSNNYYQTHFVKYKEELARLHPEIDTNMVIHGFRHSAASSITLKSSAKKAQEILRHKNISTTSAYIHDKIDKNIIEERSEILHGE